MRTQPSEYLCGKLRVVQHVATTPNAADGRAKVPTASNTTESVHVNNKQASTGRIGRGLAKPRETLAEVL